MANTNPGRFGPGSFRPGSFRPILGVGRFGLGRWVVSANFLSESIRPRVVSAIEYGNFQALSWTYVLCMHVGCF